MGKRRRGARQRSMWVATTDLPRSAAHPFYERLNEVLDDAAFDTFVETACATFVSTAPVLTSASSSPRSSGVRRTTYRFCDIPAPFFGVSTEADHYVNQA